MSGKQRETAQERHEPQESDRDGSQEKQQPSTDQEVVPVWSAPKAYWRLHENHHVGEDSDVKWQLMGAYACSGSALR